MSPNTLQKVLNQASVTPGEDGCYSTAQLLSGVYGRMFEEKLKVQQQLARRYELSNRTAEASLLDRDALMAGFSALADSLVSAVKTSNLDRQSQDTFLKNLASWPVILTDVAARQTKLPRSKNGQAEEDASES
jgi:hypothetical protein